MEHTSNPGEVGRSYLSPVAPPAHLLICGIEYVWDFPQTAAIPIRVLERYVLLAMDQPPLTKEEITQDG